MFEETFEYNLNNNYMVIKGQKEDYSSLTDRMFQENNIPGFLSFELRKIEGDNYFYYEISGKKAISKLFQKRKISAAELQQILERISAILSESEQYLLDIKKIVFHPGYIYSDFDVRKIFLLYYPDYEQENSLDTLGEFFIENVDYQDREAVELAYFFQRLVMEEIVNFKTVNDYIANQRNKGKSIEINKESERVICEDIKKETLENASLLKQVQMPIDEKKGLIQKLKERLIWESKNLGFIEKIKKILQKKRKADEEEYIVRIAYEEEEIKDQERTFVVTEETQYFPYAQKNDHYLYYQGKEDYSDFELNVFPFVIGKGDKGIDGQIKSPLVSRLHGQIDAVNDEYYITDLNSTNGTFLNGIRIQPNHQMKIVPGDKIQFAREIYLFQ